MATVNVVTEFYNVDGELLKTRFNVKAVSLNHAHTKALQHLESIGVSHCEWMHLRNLEDDTPTHFTGRTGSMLCAYLDGNSQSIICYAITNGVLEATQRFDAPLTAKSILKS